MTEENTIQKAVEQLQNAESTKVPCAPVREYIGSQNVEAAYAVQHQITKQKEARGAKQVGKKIGLTSFAVQKQLGVDQPDFGVLFKEMQIENVGSLSVKELMQPKAEAEIAFILKKDLIKGGFSLKEVEEAIDYAVAAIEIVGSRIAGWDIKIADTIADNASASHFVLGTEKKRLSEIDVVRCKMQMTQNGNLVSEGSGIACLGSPLIAVQWLANKMAELDSPLRVGDIILSGALGPMITINAGDEVSATVEGLGRVSVRFAE